ncbi:MAG TPA: 5-oxoprolinase subunit PxpA [Verrucomicrobiae bacterium]|nr:5-oxoprolinase subunit PxpA [Verrucomicrobiae bacterium]
MKLDLNCDLGEGETASRTRALMRWITSANVACGGHAGDVASMTRCCELAWKFDVRLGAHPGPWDRASFGRAEIRLTAKELETLLLQQVGALERVARAHQLELHHIKLHGALYHAVERDAALARSYLRAVGKWWPGVRVYALAGGAVMRAASKSGVEVWGEIFADRSYRDDGSLVPRGQPGAVFEKVEAMIGRMKGFARTGTIPSVSGKPLRLSGRTLCVHSDTPSAVALAGRLARELR